MSRQELASAIYHAHLERRDIRFYCKVCERDTWHKRIRPDINHHVPTISIRKINYEYECLTCGTKKEWKF